MTINNLEKLNQAPENGYMLAYMRNQVVFKKYTSLEAVKGDANGEILEIHLFDNEKEYRAICSTSKRFDKGTIETVVDFSEEDAYIADSDVNKKFHNVSKKIKVLNHINYDSNGAAIIDNYRLVCEVV